jgi:hypothetical protein
VQVAWPHPKREINFNEGGAVPRGVASDRERLVCVQPWFRFGQQPRQPKTVGRPELFAFIRIYSRLVFQTSIGG